MNIKDYRLRAIKAILRKLQEYEDDKLKSWDYQLDSIARTLLDLPKRPFESKPYIGWLTAPTKPVKTAVFRKTVSATGIELIQKWEGCRLTAYLCPAGVWTIGYGHTKTARRGMHIDADYAKQLLREDLQVFEKAINNLVQVPLTQNQFDALVSFTFNIGVGAFKTSTLRKHLNQENYQLAANEFLRWVYADRRKLQGLVSRRNEEKKLFLS